MEIYCRKECDVRRNVVYCHEYDLESTEEGRRDTWDTCVAIISKTPSIVIGEKKTLFVLFTNDIYNPYVIRCDDVDKVAEYLCSIKYKKESD